MQLSSLFDKIARVITNPFLSAPCLAPQDNYPSFNEGIGDLLLQQPLVTLHLCMKCV